MEIKINVQANGLEKAIYALAQALNGVSAPQTVNTVQAQPITNHDVPKIEGESPQVETNEQAPVSETEPKITLETVRIKLAELSQAGKRPQVKELITSFGAKRLSDIPANKYAELLQKASEL